MKQLNARLDAVQTHLDSHDTRSAASQHTVEAPSVVDGSARAEAAPAVERANGANASSARPQQTPEELCAGADPRAKQCCLRVTRRQAATLARTGGAVHAPPRI